MDTALITRLARGRLELLANAFRVVIVNGPRQAGKTTLVRQLYGNRGGTLRSLDRPDDLELATADPAAFAAEGPIPRCIDEVQRGGDQLVLAIKYLVDQENTRGQFVLSGSTRFLTVPSLSESLAGRAGFLDLWPFAVAERVGAAADFVERLFAGPATFQDDPRSQWSRDEYLHLICVGGYPEVVAHPDYAVRRAWFDGYLRTVVQRDIREFANIQHADAVPTLAALLAARAGSTAVLADLASATQLAHATTRNYLSYLDTVMLAGQVPPWATNLTAKAAKTPKYYLTDSGLAAHLLDVDESALARLGHPALGGLVETFVYAELLRLLSTSDLGVTIRHLRDRDGREVDFVLERRSGQLVGIEVKATSTPKNSDFRHLHWLRERAGEQFAGGYVLHLGTAAGSFGDRLRALPLSAMWHHLRLP